MLNIFKRELRANLKSLIIWSAAMFLMAGVGFGEYGILMAGGADINIGSVVDMMPRILKVMFGMGSIPVDTPEGWYACMFLWCAIIGYVHAALLGASIISKEERDKTSEFLYTKPITRGSIITGKIFAAVLNSFTVAFAGWAATMLVFVPHVKGTDLVGHIHLSMICMFIIQIVFLFAGLCISALFTGRGKSVRYSAAAVMAGYFISIIIEMIGNVNYLNFLTPFRYFDVAAIAEGKGIEILYIILSAFLIMVTGYFTYALYRRRELHG